MTRTEQDLKDRLSMLEPGVGAKDQIAAFARQLASQPGAPIRPFNRVRRLAPMVALPAAALVTAAVVLAAAALAPDGKHDNAQAGTLAQPQDSGISWRWLFSIDSLPAGWQAGSGHINTDFQDVGLVSPESAFCTIQVYATDAFDTSRIGANATPVTVNGTAGVYASTFNKNAINEVFPTVVWQYAPGAYALSICDQGSVDVQGDELAAASALTARQRPFAFPFAVSYLPADAVPLMAYTSVHSTGEARGVLAVSTLATGIDLNTWPLDPRDLEGAQMLTVSTLDGPRQAAYRDQTLTVLYDGFHIRIGADPRTADLDELIRIAENLEVAPNPSDPSTWFDAQDALP